ncbi:MAG: response regulator transcription factor [bacterium]|nr:response regulator transcription factor [bacterium]
MKIIIADDSDVIRERMVSMLSDLESIEIVSEVTNAEDAIKAVREKSPDVAIFDIRMPGNGINALKQVKAMNVPPIVIMYTNYPYEQYRKKCFEFGAEYFFAKSEGLEKIFDALSQIVSDHGKN